MTRRIKPLIAAMISPVMVTGLKFYTKLTGQQRSRVVIVNEAKTKTLLVHELMSNRWSLPGGGIEKGETPAMAAVRELAEEVGVHVDVGQLNLLGVLQKPAVKVDYVAHIFTVVLDDTVSLQVDNRELIDAQWFLLTRLPSRRSEITHAAFELLKDSSLAERGLNTGKNRANLL